MTYEENFHEPEFACEDLGVVRKMHTEDEFVRCPYYKNDEHQIIRCEGVEDGTALHLAFSTRTQLKEYKKGFCRSCWEKCRIAKMLDRKWGYEDGQ